MDGGMTKEERQRDLDSLRAGRSSNQGQKTSRRRTNISSKGAQVQGYEVRQEVQEPELGQEGQTAATEAKTNTVTNISGKSAQV